MLPEGGVKRMSRSMQSIVFFASRMLVAVTAALLPVGHGLAQEYNPENVGVAQRPRPDLDPAGMRAGSLVLFPRIAVEERYDDNVFSDQNDDADFITSVKPGFLLASDWSNHALNVFGDADVAFYADNNDEDYEDFNLGANGRLDVRRDSFVTGSLIYSELHEDRGSADDVNGDEPTEYDSLFPQLGFEHGFGRFRLNLDGQLQRLDFDDVDAPGTFPGRINNDDRDRDQWRGGIRLGYEIVPNYEAFVRGRYFVRRYDDGRDDFGFDRDSDGYEVVAGTAIDFTRILFGNVFAGYRRQDFDDPLLEEVDGLTFGADVTWNVTRLTTIKGFVTRRIEETTLVGASGFFATLAGVSVDHELLRNLLIGARASYTKADYEGNGREDDDIVASAYANYMLNRNFRLRAEYRLTDRDSNAPGSDFTKNVFLVRVRAQY